MKKLVIGILAHVDAGKTTLSEGMLYTSGKIRKLGRVDNKDAYLDTHDLEKARGITIFSNQAVFEIDETRFTLLDTPGHVDFSAEMERTLQVLDYAILVISGADGVQGHTRTLWTLLDIYKIPVFIFINKMDQDGTDKAALMKEMKNLLQDGCVDFGQVPEESFFEHLAVHDEAMMEAYLGTGQIKTGQIKNAIKERKIFPCYFGSALKLEGVEQFMHCIAKYTEIKRYPEEFGARVFKIMRDEQGNRLTYLKITGGKLKVRDLLSGSTWEEKVNQIRIYSGQKFEAVNEAEAGSVCAVAGLRRTRPGEGLGSEAASVAPVLEPVLLYRIMLPEGCDPRSMIPGLRQLEEEEPQLNIVWDERLQEIQVRIMGEVQVEILQSLIKSRFGVPVSFDGGSIVYKETIEDKVLGVGHFEPLKHYAEVHLLLEPGDPGSGLKYGAKCGEDVLSKNWQKHILTHLQKNEHKGVLTGSALTDVKITLISGKAHNKHTEGGDFREAACRAVRQGLMEAKSILLEPYYSFQLELPSEAIGRAMADIERMHGICKLTGIKGETAVLEGSAPVINMRNYHKEAAAYTKGLGKLFCSFKGYGHCHNAAEVIEAIGYDPENDAENPAGSVFCANGAGYPVPWDKVKDNMHVESRLYKKNDLPPKREKPLDPAAKERWISLEEIDQIINRTYYGNQGKKSAWKKHKTARESFYERIAYINSQNEVKEEYLLVDGYNIIYAWPELEKLAEDNIENARIKLLDSLCNYQWIRKCRIIVVFDAYCIQGHREEITGYDNIYVVYTKEAQTADQYIEKFARDNKKKYDIAVATSDGLQQIIVRGAGCSLLSARELKIEIERAIGKIMQEYCEMTGRDSSSLIDVLSPEVKRQMEEMIKSTSAH